MTTMHGKGEKEMKKVIVLITVFVCAFMLLGLVATASGESTEPKLEIVAGNLSFEDSVALLYAVNVTGADSDKAEMLYWTAPKGANDLYTKGTENYSSSPIADETVDEKECKVFRYDYLFAKEMTDYIYARAYITVGGQEYYSSVVKYSVLEYAYNMLGYTAEGSDDENLHKVLNNMLEYGASVQEYKNYKADNLATDKYSKIDLNGATFADNFSTELVKVGKEVTLYANMGSEGQCVTWKDSDGKVISTGDTLTITVPDYNTMYTAEYSDAPSAHTVTFVDYAGDVLKEVSVSDGESATAPAVPLRKGYNFTGWDVDFASVTSDLTVTAQYEIVENQVFIEYTDNGDGTTTATFSINGNVKFASMDLILSFELINAEYLSSQSFLPGSGTTYVDGEFIYTFYELSSTNITDSKDLFNITFSNLSNNVQISFKIIESGVSDETLLNTKEVTVVGTDYAK